MKKLMFVLVLALSVAVQPGCGTTSAPVRASIPDSSARVSESAVQEEPELPSEFSIESVKIELDKYIAKRLSDMAKNGKFYKKYALPSDRMIRNLTSFPLSQSEMDILRDEAEQLTRKYEKEIVWPAWAKARLSKHLPYAKKLLAEGQYEQCRELLWKAPTLGVEEVDAIVREDVTEFMNVSVNPVEWRAIEKDMRQHALDFAKREAFDEGIDWLKRVPHIRVFSVDLDKQLLEVRAELKKLSVNEEDVNPIIAETTKMVATAAKIYDSTDSTTNTVGTVESAGDLSEYERKIAEYREKLIQYNCTEENAEKIVDAFRKDADKLIGSLYSVETSKRSFLKLGTAAVNKRIDEFAVRLTKWLKNKKDGKAVLAKLFAEQKFEEAKKVIQEEVQAVAETPEVEIKKSVPGVQPPPEVYELVFEGEKFKWEINALVAAGKYTEAREYVWATIYPKVATPVSLYLKPIGQREIMVTINPAQWAVIEADITTHVKNDLAAHEYEKALAWLKAYPRIRVYASEIDAKLENAAAEAIGLGLVDTNVAQVTSTVKYDASEAERIANHTDEMEKVVLAGSKPNRERLQELLEEYRKTLIRNDCTEENAAKLIEAFKTGIEPHFEALAEDTSREVLKLGCNALNDRIGSLIVDKQKEVTALVEAKKEKAERELVFVREIIELVLDGKYDEARNKIRDIKLEGDSKLDYEAYCVRIGLLNCVVNPNQCEALQKEIDERLTKLYKEEKYEEIIKYVNEYPYVHDVYEDILASLDMIKDSMKGLLIADVEAEKYIENLRAELTEFLESRQGRFNGSIYGLDYKELDASLAKLDLALLQQWYDVEGVAAKTNAIRREIEGMVGGLKPAMTTAELNEKLKDKLNETVFALCAGLKDLKLELPSAVELAMAGKIRERDYLKKIKEIDAEVSFDSQIAMAEDAIAKQLGIKCPSAYLKMNAVLGEYARAMRLLKLKKNLAADQLAAMLIGSVYLDQEAVFKRALDLGAKVDAAPSRDPLKRSALLVAIQLGRGDFVKLLAASGASLAAVDANGDTSLHYAVVRGNVSIIKAMLAKTEVNAVNKIGESPVFTAARKNQAGIASVLTSVKEFDVSITNKNGETAFDVACDAGSRDVLDVLANAKAAYGTSHLVIAAKRNRLSVAQWLVEHGVDVNGERVMEVGAETALALGRHGEPCDTYRYLISQGGVGTNVCEVLCKERIAAEKTAAAQQAKEEAKKDACCNAVEAIRGKVNVVIEKDNR